MASSAAAVGLSRKASGSASLQALYSACKVSSSADRIAPALGAGAAIGRAAIADDWGGQLSLGGERGNGPGVRRR